MNAGMLAGLLLAFLVGIIVGWWIDRMERKQLRQALRDGAELMSGVLGLLPRWPGQQWRALDFIAQWRGK